MYIYIFTYVYTKFHVYSCILWVIDNNDILIRLFKFYRVKEVG